MIIHNKFTGGNIFVDKQEGDHVYLRNELRDTTTDWFYWAFCVEGAQNRELTFHFQRTRLGYWGPAVSHDLVNWHWLDQSDGDTFTYRFTEDENKVYFAHNMLCHPHHFFEFVRNNNLTVTEFCKSRKGNSVPCIRLGDGERSIILTARHHCCESSGGYVLQGVMSELVKAPIPNTRVLCVPFMDYDGVVDGDQGKNRYPHDYNRDYTDHPIYPETAAVIRYADQYGCHFGFDFHSPWHRTNEHDHIYIMRSPKTELQDLFSLILREESDTDAMAYGYKWDQPADFKNPPLPTFNSYMNHRPENVLAFTLESTYAGSAENKVSQQKLIAFGRCFARAMRRFIEIVSENTISE